MTRRRGGGGEGGVTGEGNLRCVCRGGRGGGPLDGCWTHTTKDIVKLQRSDDTAVLQDTEGVLRAFADQEETKTKKNRQEVLKSSADHAA